MVDKPQLSIVIVSYEVKAVLRECLKSVEQASSGLEVETWVVDNASSDGSADMVAQEFPYVQLIRNAVNGGFAKANNQALPKTTGEYVLLLNPDTLLREDTLQHLLDAADRHESTLLGPRIISENGKWQRSFWAFPNLQWVISRALGFPALSEWRSSYRGIATDPDQEVAVDWLSGACLMAPRTVLEQIGWLSEDYHMYMEDVDLCRQAGGAGFSSIYLPVPEIVHYGGSSSARLFQLEGRDVWRIERANSIEVYVRKFHGRFALAITRLAFAVGKVTRPIFDGLRRKGASRVKQKFSYSK